MFAVPSRTTSYQDVVSNSQPSPDDFDACMCVTVVDCDVSIGCCNICCPSGICHLHLSYLLDEGAEVQGSDQRSLGRSCPMHSGQPTAKDTF